MTRRSSIATGAVIKHFRRIAHHPWIGSKLVKLQLEKGFLSLVPLSHLNGRGGKIRQVSVRITDLCNLRCRTCGQWGQSGFLHGMDLRTLKQAEVPPERYAEVFRDLVRHGHRPLVYFWGGEPMLYAGLPELIEETSAMGLPVSIATNGTRVADMAERMVRSPLFLLQISIDGHCEEIHNQARPSAGNTNNFLEIQRALDAVGGARTALNSDLPLVASLTVVSRTNYRHLVDIYETFRSRVDLFVFYLSWWIDEEAALSHERDFSRRFGFTPALHRGWIGTWRPEDFGPLDRQIREVLSRSRPWGAPPVTLIPAITGKQGLEEYYTLHTQRFGFDRCVSIYQAVEIDSNGDLSPCRDYHDYVVGNIREQTISDLWNSRAYRRFRLSVTEEGLMPVCSRCCGLMGY
jgi:radical SAM protein with 4Fe4S-binding SPASM domain